MAEIRPLRLRFTPRARLHLESIGEYLAAHSPSAATRIGLRLQAAIRLLLSFPDMGRPGSLPGTREIPLRGLPYLIVYRVETDEPSITILGIYHGRQRRPGT